MAITWPSPAEVVASAEPIITEFEGFRSKPYLCAAGVPTIGFGTTKYPGGKKVTLADPPCTEEQARVWRDRSMLRVLGDLILSGAVKRSPTVHQAAAFLSLGYNIGVGCHDGIKGDFADSTLLDRFNAGDIAGAAAQFCAWNKARVNGQLQPVSGLTRRRARERDLFLTA